MPIVLSQSGILIKEELIINKFGIEYLKNLKEKLTVRYKPNEIAIEKILKMYNEITVKTSKILQLPRQLITNIRKMFPEEKFSNLITTTNDIDITPKDNFKLTGNQEVMMEYLFKNIFTEENVKNGTASTIIKMGTGLGKTYIAGMIIARLKKKTLIITHDKGMRDNEFSTVIRNVLDYEMVKQEELNEVELENNKSSNEPSNEPISKEPKSTTELLSTLKKQVKEKKAKKVKPKTKAQLLKEQIEKDFINTRDNPDYIKNKPITVLVINTAMKKNIEFFKQFGLIIFDEIDMYCTEKRSEIFWKTNSQYVIGLSATPTDRIDGFYKIILHSIGQIVELEKLKGFKSNENKFKAEVRAVNYYCPEEYISMERNDKNNQVMTHKVIFKIMEDPYRDKLVLKYLKELYDDEQQNIYIFTQYREYVLHYFNLICKEFPAMIKDCYIPEVVNELSQQKFDDDVETETEPETELKETPKIKNDVKNLKKNIKIMMGGITNEAYEEAKKGRIIIVSYKYFSVGKSIPKMTASIFTSPQRANWKQITGRILRLGSDTSIVRKYIDIIDANTLLKYQFYGTKKTKEKNIPSRIDVYNERGFPIKYETVHWSKLDGNNQIENYNDVDENIDNIDNIQFDDE